MSAWEKVKNCFVGGGFDKLESERAAAMTKLDDALSKINNSAFSDIAQRTKGLEKNVH